MLLQVVSLLLAVLIATFFYITEKYKYWKNVGVPGPKPVFPRGSLEGVASKYHRSEVFDKFYKQFKDKTKFIGLYFILTPIAFIIDIEVVKAILAKDAHNFINKGNYYNERDDPLSAHLFALDNPKWKPLRAKLTPTFTSGKMKMMFGTIVDVGHKFIQTLGKETENVNEIEIKDILARFTTDVIGSCAFGLECNSLENSNSEFRDMGKKALDIPLSLGVLFRFTCPNWARMLRMKFVPEDVSEFFMKVVTDTVNYREKDNIVRPDFMNLLIQMKNQGEIDSDTGEAGKKTFTGKLTVEEIGAQAFVFFMGKPINLVFKLCEEFMKNN